MVIGKLVFSRRVKEILEYEHHIFPMAVVRNPTRDNYEAWVYEDNDALKSAFDKISPIPNKAKGIDKNEHNC